MEFSRTLRTHFACRQCIIPMNWYGSNIFEKRSNSPEIPNKTGYSHMHIYFKYFLNSSVASFLTHTVDTNSRFYSFATYDLFQVLQAHR